MATAIIVNCFYATKWSLFWITLVTSSVLETSEVDLL